jgi:hypothetical protein
MATKEEAVALKLKGNKAIASHDWPAAVDYYTQAIEKYDQDATFFCNRAQVCEFLDSCVGQCTDVFMIGEYQA